MRILFWGLACALASSSIAVTSSVFDPDSPTKENVSTPFDAGQPIGSGLASNKLPSNVQTTSVVSEGKVDIPNIPALAPALASRFELQESPAKQTNKPTIVRFDEVPIATGLASKETASTAETATGEVLSEATIQSDVPAVASRFGILESNTTPKTKPTIVRFDEVPTYQPKVSPEPSVGPSTTSFALPHDDPSKAEKLFAADKTPAKKVVKSEETSQAEFEVDANPPALGASSKTTDPSGNWINPTKTTAIAVNQDVEEVTIPQQGSVDLGNNPGSTTAQPPASDVTLPGPGQTIDPQPASIEELYDASQTLQFTSGSTGCASKPTDCAASCASGCTTAPAACDSPCGCGDNGCDGPGGCSTGLMSKCGLGLKGGLGSGFLSRIGLNSNCGGSQTAVANPCGCANCQKSSCLGGCGFVGKLSKYIKVNPNASCSGWFAGGYYLNLGRDDDNWGRTLASSGGIDVLATGSARMERASGVGARFGKMFNQNSAFEVIYWQVFPQDELGYAANSITGNPINSHVSFANVTYDNDGLGQDPLDAYFQGASAITVKRSFDYRNFELNFLRLPFHLNGTGGKATLALVAGFRYFEGNEAFELFSDSLNEVRGDDPANEIVYDIKVENQLAGLQVGGLGSYQLTDKIYGQFGTKVGLYNNRMKTRQGIAGGNGYAQLFGSTYDVSSEKDDLAFLAEIDAGLAYSFNDNWRLNAGYKLVAVSSYADATSQIPYNFTIPNAQDIQDNNSLILHGFFIGAEYAF